jgi:hypothetical protein
VLVAAIREVRVITSDGIKATIRIEYEDGSTQVVVADQLKIPSPVQPTEVKLQVARELMKLSVSLQQVVPDQIVIIWTAE